MLLTQLKSTGSSICSKQESLVEGIRLDLSTLSLPFRCDVYIENTNIFTNDQINVTIVSRLVSHKNIEKIIKAISDLNDPLIYLNIIGDGPELNQLQKISLESNNKDNIIFPGPWMLYQACPAPLDALV